MTFNKVEKEYQLRIHFKFANNYIRELIIYLTM